MWNWQSAAGMHLFDTVNWPRANGGRNNEGRPIGRHCNIWPSLQRFSIPMPMPNKSLQDRRRSPKNPNSGDIPPDFDRQWGISDVAIRTNNCNDKMLHVNKSVLATFSPFFRALFFAEFAEKLQDVVDVDIEYDVLKEILRIIHSVNRNYGETDHKLYPHSMLAKLYRTADTYDIPCIRELCKQQFVQTSPREAFEVTIELELHDEKSEVLKRMTFEDVETFLRNKSNALVLSPNDVAEIVRKCKENEKTLVRCQKCQSTDIQVNTERNGYHSSQHYYKCNACNHSFYKSG